MSAIIDNAETIRYQRQVSIAQTKSQSGVRQAQRRGPLLYNFFIELRPLRFGSIAYFAIEDEILDSNYSTTTIDSTITLGNLTTQRGIWSGTPLVDNSSSEQTGNSIDVTVAGQTTAITNYARKGDFVQFVGYTKVFQLTDNADLTSDGTDGSVTLELNGAIPASETLGNGAVRFGPNVVFKLQLKDRPEPEFHGLDTVQYSSAAFEEVL